MARRQFQRGDFVIYRKTKRAPRPGPRARDIIPSEHGDDYAYCVDKFWVVTDVRSTGELVVRTRRGKVHVMSADDPNLRRAGWLARLIFGPRFPNLEDEPASVTSGTIPAKSGHTVS
jgi:hypothetical protein